MRMVIEMTNAIRVISVGLCLALSFSLQLLNAQAKDLGVYGQTFPIKEMDIVEYIQNQLKDMKESGELARHQEQIAQEARANIKRPKPISGIKHTDESRSFLYDPTYQVQEDITDHENKIIHKKGTRVNPLEHVSWGADMLFIDGDDERQIKWVQDYQTEINSKDFKDKVIVLVKGEPILLEDELQTRIYFDQEGKITSQLGITQVPAVVIQENKHLRIREIKLESKKDTK